MFQFFDISISYLNFISNNIFYLNFLNLRLLSSLIVTKICKDFFGIITKASFLVYWLKALEQVIFKPLLTLIEAISNF